MHALFKILAGLGIYGVSLWGVVVGTKGGRPKSVKVEVSASMSSFRAILPLGALGVLAWIVWLKHAWPAFIVCGIVGYLVGLVLERLYWAHCSPADRDAWLRKTKERERVASERQRQAEEARKQMPAVPASAAPRSPVAKQVPAVAARAAAPRPAVDAPRLNVEVAGSASDACVFPWESDVQFPPQCCCCSDAAPPDSTMTVTARRGRAHEQAEERTLAVPVCGECRSHWTKTRASAGVRKLIEHGANLFVFVVAGSAIAAGFKSDKLFGGILAALAVVAVTKGLSAALVLLTLPRVGQGHVIATQEPVRAASRPDGTLQLVFGDARYREAVRQLNSTPQEATPAI